MKSSTQPPRRPMQQLRFPWRVEDLQSPLPEFDEPLAGPSELELLPSQTQPRGRQRA